MKVFPMTRCATLILLALLLIMGAALAQVPDQFTNLKVFPKDIGKRDLVDAMRSYTAALGVRCTHCHVQKTPGDFSSIDWASDDIDHKKTARGMMTMVSEINQKLLPAAGEHDAKVRCITCHRGLTDPATLDQVLLEFTAKEGAPAAVTKYRELRQDYYGTGSYDFSPATLNQVAQVLAQQKGDMAAAMTFVDLNLEMSPQDANGHLMKAQLLQAKGDNAGALASVNKALELDPANEQAKKMLEQLKQPK